MNKSTLVAIAKNEGRYLLEWIAYYKLIGFDRIVIYDNDSDDNGPELLAALAWKGEIEHIPWPGADEPQPRAYEHAMRMLKGAKSWIAFLDCDEFLDLRKHETIGEFLADYPYASGVVVNWLFFGSSGLEHYDPRPVIERFTRSELESRPTFKSIVRMVKATGAFINYCHRPEVEGEIVTTDGMPLKTPTNPVMSDVGRHDIAVLNHYFTKSREEFEWKRARGRADRAADAKDKIRPVETFKQQDINRVETHSILRRLDGVKRELKRLSDVINAD